MSKAYKIEVIKEPGVDPFTGELYPLKKEAFIVEAGSARRAYELAQLHFRMETRGQTLKFFIDGEEYVNESF